MAIKIALAAIKDKDDKVIETKKVDINEFESALKAEEPDPADYGIWVQLLLEYVLCA